MNTKRALLPLIFLLLCGCSFLTNQETLNYKLLPDTIKQQDCIKPPQYQPASMPVMSGTSYFGFIDRDYVSLTLDFSGSIIHGLALIFGPSDYLQLDLAGCLESERSAKLWAYDEDGYLSAVIWVKFPEIDPNGGYQGIELERQVIVGKWQAQDSLTSHSVYFLTNEEIRGVPGHQYIVAGVVDDQKFEDSVRLFLEAVANDDRATVSARIQFPIYAWVQGELLEFRTKEEFLKYYDQIFTQKFKARLAEAIPTNMFSNWRGIMILRGEIWFEARGQVIAINNGLFFLNSE